MIQDTKYEDGKILMLDNKVGPIEQTYQDNIDDIIATKNIIEVLEDKIKEVEKKINELEKEKNIYLFISCFGTLFIGFLLNNISIPALLNTHISFSIVFGAISSFTLLAIEAFGLSQCIGTVINNSKKTNKLEKLKKEQIYERDFQKELLIEYENNKTRDLENLYKNNPNKKIEFISKMNKELKIIRNRLEEYKNNIDNEKTTNLETTKTLKKTNKEM